jgi:pimeloyl-ACP methyl ester carboxylesterase
MRVDVAPDIALAVHDLGGTGEPLLLAHATGFHGRVWRALATELHDEWHGWAPDLRGHGDSAVPEGHPMAWDGFADDVVAVVGALGLPLGRGALVGVGHSKGGAALLTAEVRHPSTFRALWLYEPIVAPAHEGPATGENAMAAGAERRRATFTSRDDALANFASKPPLDVLRADVLADYVHHGFAVQADGSVMLKCRPEVEAATYRMGPLLRTWDRLGDVRCPVVIAGGGDGGFPGSNAPGLAARIPGGIYQPFPTLGHFGPLEDPVGVAHAIRAFFSA